MQVESSERVDWAAERRALVDGIWPAGCRVCDTVLADELGCAEHAFLGEERGVLCGLCSRGLPGGIVAPTLDPAAPWLSSGVVRRTRAWRRCRECRERAPGYGRLVCLGDYGGALRAWVLALKNGRRGLAEPLARVLAERLRGAGWAETAGVRVELVPIPSHPWRVFERGADGPDWLARALGRELGWPVRRRLRRVRFTRAQGDPGSVSRTDNVHGALAAQRVAGVAGWWQRRRADGEPGRVCYVMVDDVVTSGATLAEAARVLRRGAAQEQAARRPQGTPIIGAVSIARARWRQDA